ncbi:2-hydroxy-3-oxopropionate reductase [Rhodospirillales bacterium TMPK1]|uniref:2-hydroxy-3-oxopropionate reductase n=2 Tax=Roseiterribacter gracilis TaxID=2812848 RepID=A0A8S8XJG7_9PROT|nr:2-hydroxy-3-oxopropionate reductase [Rhodospirillales bacterium TMPK1]
MSGLRVTVLGLGLMGAPMALRLVQAGHQVTVYNRTRDKTAALERAGAKVADSAADAVASCEVAITMLSDDDAVAAVLDEILPALPTGATVIDMSSVRPDTARAHAAKLEAQDCFFLDAPVSGGQIGARDGTLSIMVGGNGAAFARWSSLLGALGKPLHVGPTGAGQLAKLANQLLVGVTLAAVGEALLLLQRGGADVRAAREALLGGFANSRVLDVHGQRMLDGQFEPGGYIATQLKDLDNVLIAAGDLQLPTAEVARDLFAEAVEQHLGDRDQAAIYLTLATRNFKPPT